jgi:hypothetical protein
MADWRDELGLAPFVGRFGHKARRRMCPLYVAGLIEPGDRKSVGPMAERVAPVDYDRLHHFVSDAVWDEAPLLRELALQADKLVGGADAFLVIDDTALPKKGTHSVGVAPQYASAPGKTADCQTLVPLTLARGEVPVMVGLRLFLPETWTGEARLRRAEIRSREPANGSRPQDAGRDDQGALDSREGRSWRGLHRHALMTMIAYAFLQHRQLVAASERKTRPGASGGKKSLSRPATANAPGHTKSRRHRPGARSAVDKCFLPLLDPISTERLIFSECISRAHWRTFLLRNSLVVAIRTVMITTSPIFRDLVTELMVGHRTLDVVGEFDTSDGIEEQLQQLAPDLILIKLRRNEGDEIGLELARLLPSAKVIAFSNDARDAFVYRMPLQRTSLLDVSPKMLIDAIIES